MVSRIILALGAVLLVGCTSPFSGYDRLSDIGGTDAAGLGFAVTPDIAGDDVVADTRVPYGTLARNCTVSTREMGRKTATFSGFTLYDSAPKSNALRTQYLTGFRDGCARQFSGTMTVFGDIGTHEMVRYVNVGLKRPYSATDEAYEVIKASFCRVKRGQPCGDRLDALAKRTTFVSIYPSFAGNTRGFDVLLYNGEVAATDLYGG